MNVASINHIVLDDAGVARVVGHRTKVIQVVMDKMANGWNAEQIQQQYPHLSLAQVHAALAFYYDHQAELDEQIQRDGETADRLRAESGTFPPNGKSPVHDLDELAGTWTDEQANEFDNAIAPFNKVDENLWK